MNRSLFWTKLSLQYVFTTQGNSLLKQLLLILGGTLFLSLAAQVSINLQPVPLTFQSCTVLLISMLLGACLGVCVVMSYITLGGLGLPIFAGFTGGLTVLLGSNGGYFFGFLLAGFISGYLAEHGFAKNSILSFISALIGTTIIFLCGYLYLATFIGWQQAYLLGVHPFLISEPIKLLLLSLIAPRFWKKQQRITTISL